MDKTLQKFLKRLKDSESSTSIIFGAIVVIVVGILISNFVKSNRLARVNEEGQATESGAVSNIAANGFTQPVKLPSTHTVERGEHLWGISEKYYGSGYNYVDVAKVNNGTEVLQPGMVLTIPDVEAKQLTVKAVPGVVTVTATILPDPNRPITTNTYVVQRGDSLWNIAVRAYGDGYKWTSVWEANKAKVQDPNMIDPGLQLTLLR